MREYVGDGPTGATFSECNLYRYALWRRWDTTLPLIAFCGLNPSTADEIDNDPTCKRWIGFAKSWGHGGMIIVNAFGLRETKAAKMKRHSAPIGPENDDVILAVSGMVDRFVCCWGNDGIHLNRCNVIRGLLRNRDLHCFQLTGIGQPGHPLYLPSNLTPILWRAASA